MNDFDILITKLSGTDSASLHHSIADAATKSEI